MDPKFVKLEEAAEQLKVSTDTLNGLREEGKLRAYRDGSSWKFRTEEIEKMAAEGVPSLEAEESGLNFDLNMDDDSSGLDFDLDDMSLGDEISLDDVDEAAPVSEKASDVNLEGSDAGNADAPLSDLDLADDELELATGSSADLTLDLDSDGSDAPLEMPTITGEIGTGKAGESGLDIDLEIESGDDPESILLSEAELGDSADGPASTIIGKAELADASDLELASDPSDAKLEADAKSGSDVELADLEDLGLGADATGELPVTSGAADFDDIEELEIDLEAESSRILTPEDVAAAQAAGSQAQQKAPETSDLALDLDDDLELAATSDAGLTGLSGLDSDDDDDIIAGSQINLAGESSGGSGPGLTGLSALELDDDDDDDDFVLGDGSDLTLSSADSGINLSPADSGLSLDDAALELTGSALGSEIDFGEASGLVADEPAGADFELTPMAEDPAGDDDDSSQVIALDEFEEQQGADDLLGAGAGGAAMAPAAAGFGQGAVVARDEAQFPVWVIALMSLGLILLSLCGMMMFDVVRSMWSWDEPYQVNSTIIDGLSGILFP